MRDSSKPSKDSDAAEASEASMNSVIPMANIRRKPMRSATADKGSRETTTTRLYAMTAQTTSAGSMDKRSEEHTSELQSLMRISYAVFCLQKKRNKTHKANKLQTERHTIQ